MSNFGNGYMAEIAKASAPNYPWWSSEEAFDEHMQRIAENGRGKCALAAGNCCMTLILDKFKLEARYFGARAIVWGDCSNDACPRPALVVETVINLAKDGETLLRVSRGRD